MSIKEGNRKINSLFSKVIDRFNERRGFLSTDIYIVLIIILVGISGFGLGRLSTLEEGKFSVYIENDERVQINLSGAAVEAVSALGDPKGREQEAAIIKSGLLVASKNGLKYHYPWCSGAQRMKEENKIWFDSAEEARKAGYMPAANCKGLK